MVDNITDTVVGACVIAVAVGFLIYVTSFSNGEGRNYNFDLRASFRDAGSVSVGTDVRLAGIKIGTVTAMILDSNNFRANLYFLVQDGLNIPDDSSVAIGQEGLLGDTYVEIIPGASDVSMAKGAEFTDTQGAVSLLSLLLNNVTNGKI